MKKTLVDCELFAALEPSHLSRVVDLAERRDLTAGEQLFELGSEATHVYVVAKGTVELCLPLRIHGEVKEVIVESLGPKATIGWSALVKPYRMRLTARAQGPVTLAALDRVALQQLVDQDAEFGRAILGRIAETISSRLLRFQALWARELQRLVAEGLGATHQQH